MVLNLKAATLFGAVILAGMVSPPLYSLRKQCFAMNSNLLLTRDLSIAEPILKCSNTDGSRDYSVFLIFENTDSPSKARTPYLKVVDNKNQEIKWEGTKATNSGKWQDWAIEIYQDKNENFKEKVSIKVPVNNRTFRMGWERISIPCQISQLKLKYDTKESLCAGYFLLGSQMKLKLKENDVVLSYQFDWKDDFKNKPVFCAA
ncbi:hypothetical protein WEN_00245 [Mycoplasma wenyonii str. Massachusetts]|uniref:Uncharacterized protein n=1 Tax=Mycoplasma wenyonii (strain Massachusetts) TaxID=1197325 RepID=I6YA87_MYCWM|nr:hypothetical protein [Mycoplasma wenyonii]AFN64856.1 hypothetical protein WEN_00245 [Mycoplasma wenyonii str. Massachusetts]